MDWPVTYHAALCELQTPNSCPLQLHTATTDTSKERPGSVLRMIHE